MALSSIVIICSDAAFTQVIDHGIFAGGVQKRPNWHRWKRCDLHGSVGSNPTSSATWFPNASGSIPKCWETCGFAWLERVDLFEHCWDDELDYLGNVVWLSEHSYEQGEAVYLVGVGRDTA